jgi:hypothetical protein
MLSLKNKHLSVGCGIDPTDKAGSCDGLSDGCPSDCDPSDPFQKKERTGHPLLRSPILSMTNWVGPTRHEPEFYFCRGMIELPSKHKICGIDNGFPKRESGNVSFSLFPLVASHEWGTRPRPFKSPFMKPFPVRVATAPGNSPIGWRCSSAKSSLRPLPGADSSKRLW